jgi:hypothetical protein
MLGPVAPMLLGSPKPVTAFIISLIGGTLILAGALVVLYLYLLLLPSNIFAGADSYFESLLGLATGPAIMIIAVLFYTRPVHHVVYGSVVIVLSLVSWVSFLGGLFAGLILGVVGGVLIIVWQPPLHTAGYYPTLSPYPAYRTCAQCGRAVVADSRFCSYCGQPFT